MSKIIEALNENLQVVYRKAIDADAALDSLSADGKGKFETIFGDESPFAARSKRFKAYVEEVAGDVSMLQKLDNANEESPDENYKKALALIVKKIEFLLTTMEQFKGALKAK